MLQPKIDWISKVPYFVTLSAVMIVVGCGAFWYYGKKGELLDIEFASGTSVQFELKQPLHIDQLRKLIPEDNPSLPAPAVVSVGNDDKTYEIVTPSADAVAVRKVILDSLGDRLKIDLPSSFADVGQPGSELVDKLIVPLHRDHLDDLKAATGGWIPGDWQSYRGGAAVVMKDIDPPLAPSQIRARIDRERLQPVAGQTEQRYRDIVVESPHGNDDPTKLAVVMISDPLIPFQDDPAKWRDELAVPMWKTIGDAINKPANLQKVSNFDAQVAGDTQRDASLALVLSLIVIMIYIWLRFGNLKFGTATMLAMVHDTMLVLAAIGLSHLFVHFAPAIAHGLLLEPFRLNITIVAAILTVMSYSMIDTIVVFDRVRENRGKFGHLDRKVVNDSINQTMSRTLLTAGTNIVTLFFMYIFGGPGIHGFTFVLLFGILVGTYSSIAIAAPILLITRKHAQQPQPQASGKKAAVAARLQRVGG
jgi:SecD/SecF fusion protein